MQVSPIGHMLLGLLHTRPLSGYEMKALIDRSTRFFWAASYGQIYPELRGLEGAGLVRASEEPRGRRPRRVYELTPKGEGELSAWLLGANELYEVRDEGLLRLFFGELLQSEDLLALVERRRAWFEMAAAHFRGIAAELGEVEGPSGEVLRYGIELMDWNAAWWADLARRLVDGRAEVAK